MLNPNFRQAYAIAKAIPARPAEGKRRVIALWCQLVKKAIAA